MTGEQKAEEAQEECPTCDGTGEVHSHNPICWTCRGKGKTSPSKAAEAKRRDAAFPTVGTWEY